MSAFTHDYEFNVSFKTNSDMNSWNWQEEAMGFPQPLLEFEKYSRFAMYAQSLVCRKILI